MTSPFMWYLNRGTGVVLLGLLSMTTVLGILATGRQFSARWPRFVTQGLHRALAGLSVALLLVHIVTAVVDEYVDIRWWQALVPFGGTYKPLWLGLGALALDLLIAVVITSLLRDRISPRLWFVVHLLAYAAWAVSVVHGLGIGSDSRRDWMVSLTLVCVSMVGAGALGRLGLGVAGWWQRRSIGGWP
ncbi:MAG: ferric reductase-like transmembrane domain-containing protein [Tetrasphaera sp.]|nr:ferric reductase-like transmembrane domain-containing protein [Tetrasphaera sp.]